VSQAFKIVATSIAIATLSACGGGGDASSPPSRFTQADVKGVATLGAQAIEETGQGAALGFAYWGGWVEAMAYDSGGSRSSDASGMCTTGTARVEVVKSAIRTGLATGDQVTLAADNCAVAGAGIVVSGVVKLTAQETIVAPSGGDFTLRFSADATGFSYTNASQSVQLNGVANTVIAFSGGGNTTALSVAVPDGHSLSALLTAYQAGKALPAISVEYGAGTTFDVSDTSTPNSATRKLNGVVVMSAAGASMRLAISTPSALLGTTSTGLFVPSSGVINTTTTDENLATSTTVSGVRASVSGDSDRDGSLDLVFDSSWSALVTP